MYWGAVFFYDSKRSIGEVFFTTRRGVLEKSFLRLEEEYWRSPFYDSKRSIGEVLFTTRRGVLEKSFLRLEEEYWRSPFYDSKRSIGEVLFTTRRGVLEKSFFLINFIGVIFEAGNETPEKIWSDIGAEKSEERSGKRVVFVHTAVFERARKWCVKKFSLSERNFFVHVRHFKAVFFIFLIKRFGYDFVLILDLFR